MPEPAQVRLEEGAQVRNAIFEHRDAIEAHAESPALIALRVEPARLDDGRMHHAAAQDLEPRRALADLHLATFPGAVDVDLHRRLGEREMRGAEAHLHV